MWCEGDDSAIDKFKMALACSDLWAIDKLNIYRHLSEIYLRKGDEKESLHCLYLAGECTDVPRADVCCDLGDRLYFKGKYKEAIKINSPEALVSVIKMTDNVRSYIIFI